MALSQCFFIASHNIFLTKFSLFLQHFLWADINLNILKLLILTFLLVSLNILAYYVSELLFIIVSGAIVRYNFKSYFSFKNSNDSLVEASKSWQPSGISHIRMIDINEAIPVKKEQLIIKPEVVEVLTNSVESSNTGISLGWWILGAVIVVTAIVIGAKLYNGGAGDTSSSVARLNDKLIKIEGDTSIKFNELNDRVTHISTRVTKIEDNIKVGYDSLELRGYHTTKQVLAASKQALEAGSVAEAAYVSAYNLSKAVPNLEGRIAAIEKRLNNS
jgi:hypothetical protein